MNEIEKTSGDEITESAEATNSDESVLTEFVREEFIAKSHRGPLPSPDQLIAYDEALPGTAAKIIEAWEAETAHRHKSIDRRQDLESDVVDSQIKRDRAKESYASRGQWMALALMVIGFGIATLIFLAHPTGAGAGAAAAVVGFPICGVVITFITGRKSAPPMSDTTGILPEDEEITE